MNNSEKFTLAHQIAKTLEGDYIARFALALIQVNKMQSFEIIWKTECSIKHLPTGYYKQQLETAAELISELRAFSINGSLKYYAA